MPSLKERGYYPVSIDMRGLVSTYLSIQSSSFDTAFLIYINRFLGTQYESKELTSLFEKSSCIPEFKDEKVVLLLDEFDSIAEIPTEERTRFLAALSSMKQNKTLYFLHSCLAITNFVGEYFGQPIDHSPFNVSNPIYGDYFNEHEVELFFNEYEIESNKKVSSEIRNQIFKLTSGANYYVEKKNQLMKNVGCHL